MELRRISSKITLVKIPNRADLAMTFLRFQEYYENPEFRNKVFTMGQFKDWYGQKYGAFTYDRDWSGFNIPSYVLDPFIRGLFDPLTEAEQELLYRFRHRSDKHYIIGVGKKEGALDHEIAHGLFYTDEDYKREVMWLLSSKNKSLQEVYGFVKGLMYHEAVWLDEVHAYMSADYNYLLKQGIDAPESVHKALVVLREKYLKKQQRKK